MGRSERIFAEISATSLQGNASGAGFPAESVFQGTPQVRPLAPDDAVLKNTAFLFPPGDALAGLFYILRAID